MRIYPITNNSFNKQYINKNKTDYPARNTVTAQKFSPVYAIKFTSLKETAGDENLFLDTAFYRDMPTLIGFSKLMKEKFPDGADIMDFACSNGEETISLYTLLNNNYSKYNIHAYDTSDKALMLANKNLYRIHFAAYDNFLIKDNISDPIYLNLKKRFHNVMEEVPDSIIDERISPKILQDKYFRIKDEYKDDFKFQKGDIRDILNIQPQKQVGAIFFRNALYHLTNNHPYSRILDTPTLNKIWNTNKEEVIEDIVGKVYEKLLPGGFFVIGTDEKEHIYQADKFTPRNEIYHDEYNNEYIRLKSPLTQALQKDNRFKPVLSARCSSSGMGDFTIYTVWQKVEE